MSQYLEIEFKNMLTEPEYYKLKQYFNLNDESIKKQTNIYFDTLNMDLKNNGSALRVRIKNQTYELTMKQKADVGLIETTDSLSEAEYHSLLNSHIIPHKTVFRQLEKLNISEVFEIASLTTYRFEFPYQNQLIALDKSIYYDHIDYEIELETNCFEEGKSIFNNLLKDQSIPNRHAVSKIQRATEYKLKKGY